MKDFLLATTPLLIALLACGSMEQMTDDMREVVTVEETEVTKEEAYDGLMQWIGQYYTASSEVLQMEDRESGTIVIRAVAEIGMLPVWYHMTMDVRDNRIRYTQTVGQARRDATPTVPVALEMHRHFEELRRLSIASITEDTF